MGKKEKTQNIYLVNSFSNQYQEVIGKSLNVIDQYNSQKLDFSQYSRFSKVLSLEGRAPRSREDLSLRSDKRNLRSCESILNGDIQFQF